MSVNKYKPHVWVIPEDDANRQLANGFLQSHTVNIRAIGINPPAGGWTNVLDVFEDEFVPYLRKWQHAHVVMLIDFDNTNDRGSKCDQRIPDDLKQRVFVLSSRENPERLKTEPQ